MKNTVLVINPGSTSTKVACFAEHQLLAEETIRHTTQEISSFKSIFDQLDFRKNLIVDFIEKNHIKPEDLIAAVGRGGLLKPIPGGTYSVDDEMIEDLKSEKYSTHASNLGAVLANEFAELYGIPAYIVDPVVVDEFDPIARISGLEGIERRSVGHALNQKAAGRKVLADNGYAYEESNIIVAHLGGGISIGAHQKGRMIDVVNGLDGEGPYSPERTGGLPLIEFARVIQSKGLSIAEAKALIAGNGGIKSYLNETDLRIIDKKIAAGDQKAQYYIDGMCYQIAKSIGEMATVLAGRVDFIVLTGGVSYSAYIVDQIKANIEWIAPVEVLPGEMEMKALYEGVVRVFENREPARNYKEANIKKVEVGQVWQETQMYSF